MFAIQPINKFYSTVKYVGIHSDTKLPYIVYATNPNCPKDVYYFGTLEAAVDYLNKFINRENIDINNLTTSQTIDIYLVNNANQFDIVEYEIVDDKMKIISIHTQQQFNRDSWYKG